MLSFKIDEQFNKLLVAIFSFEIDEESSFKKPLSGDFL
jgi:hypothetical protein